MRCVSSEGVNLSQLPLLSPSAPHVHNCSDGVVAMGTAVNNNHNDLTSDSDKIVRPAVGKTADLNSASLGFSGEAEVGSTLVGISGVSSFNSTRALLSPSDVKSTSASINDSISSSERDPTSNSCRSSPVETVGESINNERQSAPVLNRSSSITDSRPNNETQSSTFSFSSSLKTLGLSKEDRSETSVLRDDASVLSRCSASSFTVTQSSNSETQTSAFRSASQCTNESEPESHTYDGINMSSAVITADEEMTSNTTVLRDVANTSFDLDDTLNASCDDGEVLDQPEHIYENTMFCAASPAVRDPNATLTKDSEEKEKDVLYQNISDTASLDSRGSDTPTCSQPRISSHESSPLPTFSFDLEPQPEESNPLSKDLTKDPEAKPTLPERYRHVLRRNGSYGNLGGCYNGGGSSGRGSDQDLMSREKDLGSALAWIRHEIVEMKEQDKLLLKRFIELRASILQLRCMYDVLGSTSDISSMDGSCVSLNESRKSPRMHNLVRTESDAMMSGAMFKATSSLSLPCSPQLSRLRWTSGDLI